MAATNRPDILDKALLRPGRFDRQITVDNPHVESREKILEIHAKNKKLDESVSLEEIAKSTPGFSGADLENLLNEAALHAARQDRNTIEKKDVEEARDKIMMGLEREGMQLDDDTRKMIAYHEAGHALIAAALPNSDPIHKVTIVPRGKAMGVTMQLPSKEQYIVRKEYMVDRLSVLMGGRAAENIIFSTATSGAENDLKQATKIARKMVLDWGMSDEFENMAYGEESEQVFLGKELSSSKKYSEETGASIDKSIKKILDQANKTARDILTKYSDQLDKIAELLLEHEEIEGKQVDELLSAEE
jgi:cell division protease FtsH